MQDRRNSIAKALELHLSCTNPLICNFAVSTDDLALSGPGESAGTVMTKFWFGMYVRLTYRYYWESAICCDTPFIEYIQQAFACELDPKDHISVKSGYNSKVLIQGNGLENVVCEMGAISSRPLWVKVLSFIQHHPMDGILEAGSYCHCVNDTKHFF